MKYMGSKNRISKYLVPIINTKLEGMDAYVEPFVGGANLIDKVRKDKVKIGADYNEYLIEFWKAFQGDFIPKDYYTREEYNHIRENKDEDKATTGYVGINCSYSGKWFGGFAGIVNTKQGVRNYQAEAKRNVMRQRENILDVNFVYSSYDELDIPKNSVVYCDPPYRGTTKYEDDIDHDMFYEWCKSVRDEGNIVLVSEYSMPKPFKCVWSQEVRSSLSANGVTGGSKKSVEKLFVLE